MVSIPFAIGSIIASSQSNQLARSSAARCWSSAPRWSPSAWSGSGWCCAAPPRTTLTHWDLLLPLLIAGLGNGAFIAPNAQFIIATVDRAEAGAASGVVSTVQRVGQRRRHRDHRQRAVRLAGDHRPGPGASSGFLAAAADAMAVSALLSIVSFALVFVLPKQVDAHGGPPADQSENVIPA